MSFYKKVGETHRYIVKDGDCNQNTLLVEVGGKIKALRAAGLPVDLRPAQPAESRWGKVISLEDAKEILNVQKPNLKGLELLLPKSLFTVGGDPNAGKSFYLTEKPINKSNEAVDAKCPFCETGIRALPSVGCEDCIPF